MRFAWLIVALSACASTMRVTSTSPGARVLVDGADTGEVTPTELTSWDVGSGEHKVTVETAAGRAAERPAKVGLSVKAIIGSIIFWPLVFPNAMRGFRDVEPRELHFDTDKNDDALTAE